MAVLGTAEAHRRRRRGCSRRSSDRVADPHPGKGVRPDPCSASPCQSLMRRRSTFRRRRLVDLSRSKSSSRSRTPASHYYANDEDVVSFPHEGGDRAGRGPETARPPDLRLSPTPLHALAARRAGGIPPRDGPESSRQQGSGPLDRGMGGRASPKSATKCSPISSRCPPGTRRRTVTAASPTSSSRHEDSCTPASGEIDTSTTSRRSDRSSRPAGGGTRRPPTGDRRDRVAGTRSSRTARRYVTPRRRGTARRGRTTVVR